MTMAKLFGMFWAAVLFARVATAATTTLCGDCEVNKQDVIMILDVAGRSLDINLAETNFQARIAYGFALRDSYTEGRPIPICVNGKYSKDDAIFYADTVEEQ